MRKWIVALLTVLLVATAGDAEAIEQQNATNWCWASAVQEVLMRHGSYVPQPVIVARLTGWPQNRPAYTHEVVALLRSFGLPATQAYRPGSPQELYGTLASGRMIVALVRPGGGMQGHFVVFEGVTPSGGIVVADPWTATTGVYSPAQVYSWGWTDAAVTP